jgi:hypothetical protein
MKYPTLNPEKIALALSLSVFIIFSGCSPRPTAKNSGTPNTSGSSSSTVNNNILVGVSYVPSVPVTTPNICNPFDGAPDKENIQVSNGLQATVLSMPASTAKYPTNLTQFAAAGYPLNAHVYFNSLNTPTQYFSRGFPNAAGQPLNDSFGTTVDQWFMVQLNAKIRLNPPQKQGLRQFALLADDGAIFQINQGNGLLTHINNDTVAGGHVSELSCGASPVWLGMQNDLPIHLDYYQGPHSNIALVLLWRLIPDQYGTGDANSPMSNSATLSYPACNVYGDQAFFNTSVSPSQPQPLWTQMLADGWQVVPAANYVLPGNAANPCYQP